MCEGLNFIAGLLLLVVKDEEQTFSLVSTLLNNILPGASYDAVCFVRSDSLQLCK